jgi:aerobic carbon-monoxide dehydrogenase medium subunit
MKPARFSYEVPATLASALAALAARREAAKVIAGGQSLAPMMNMRLVQPAHLVDINSLVELEQIRLERDRLVVGALVRHADLARDTLVREYAPMIAYAAGTIGHYAIRQRGTIGGSLAHADPAAQLPLVATTLDAMIEIASERGRRMVPATEFFLSIFTTALEPDELLVAVHIPLPAHQEGWGFRLFTRRTGDFALVSVAVTLALRNDGAIGRLRLAVGGIGSKPVRLDAAIPQNAVDTPDPAWVGRVADVVAAAAEIEENERIPVDYRQDLLASLVRDGLADAVESAR